MGPKLDELKEALAFCPLWSFEKRKWLGLLLLQAMGVYCLHHNSRILFESAITVFDDEAMGSYPWGQTAYEVLIDYIKTLVPEGGSYTISGMTVALLIWAYESIACFGENFGRVVNNEDVMLLQWGGKRTRASFDNLLAAEIKEHGEVRVRIMVLKDSTEEMFPKWSGEPDDPQLVSLITYIHEGKVAATEKGSSEEEGSKDLENKATLATIVSTLENISRKFDQIDSWFDAYELERNRPLTDQKTIDDMVKALVEERLKEFYKDTWVKRTLAEEFDKDTWVKRNLAEEFGSVAKATDLNFVYVSPSKATKDDKDAKVPAYGRGCRGRRTVKDEDVADKKKAVQAEAALKRKEKDDAKTKEAELKKQKLDTECAVTNDEVLAEENKFSPESDVENQKVVRSAVVKEYREKHVHLSPKGFSLTAVSSPPVFSYIGDDGTTCMRKNVKPSSAIYDSLAPVDPVLFEKLMQHIKETPPKPPAPVDKPAVLSADHESDFYSILIHERPWPEKEYGWVFDNISL
ncbi:uncharacterized protein LOC125587289 [Brassica napus]|uniref:uncharacterized protein LOC125587289 n=1 Tax=Brassica napus TaxID=3708 RepID=UPI0020796FE2|nr:uncharacterized protein LOC125587289 [Brassica napus]